MGESIRANTRHDSSFLKAHCQKRIEELYDDIATLNTKMLIAGPSACKGYEYLIGLCSDAIDVIYNNNFKKEAKDEH